MSAPFGNRRCPRWWFKRCERHLYWSWAVLDYRWCPAFLAFAAPVAAPISAIEGDSDER